VSGLHYQITGTGPLLLLLHPVGLDSRFWGAIPDALAQRNRVVTIDFRGHGKSPDAYRPGRMETHVDDIVRLMGEFEAGPAAIVGISFGGMVAQNLACRRPDLVSALVLAACPGVIPQTARSAILKRGADAESGGMKSVVDGTLSRWFTPDYLSTEAVADVRARLLADSPANWAATWEAVSEHDALAELEAIRAPALLLAGELDEATPLEAKRALAAAIPGSRLEILAGAPHMMQIECGARLSASLSTFIGELAEGER